MRFLQLVILAILLMSGSVHAALPNEQPELQRLGRAMGHLLGAMGGSIAGVTSANITRQTRVPVGQATLDTVGAVDALNDALSAYLGVTVNASPMPVFTYAERRSRAVERLDRTLDMIGRATPGWTAARGLNQDPEYQANVSRVIGGLQAAQDELQAFDRSLDYASVYPGPATPNGSHTVVGPHGDFDGAMWNLWRASHYFTRAMGDIGQALVMGYPSRKYIDAGRPYMSLSQAIQNAMTAQLIYANVAASPVDRFFTVLNGINGLTNGAHPNTPAVLHFLAFEWQPLMEQFGRNRRWDALVIDAIVITHDAWKHSDNGAWSALLFPDCSVLNNPVGCGGR